ncbi:MAG: BTAD domain-containing putative transcriptional regulator [Anaerolineaceae bacterium]|nr:BTAD domain-containing putative transcriptional regulator [Anaerolineaceae bacterium]
MSLTDLVIRSKLIPPRQRRGGLRRSRLEKRLKAALDYPLTILQAGTGYGKTTLVASLATSIDNLFWYTITDLDRDPLVFLVHLLAAFGQKGQAWSDSAFKNLEENDGRVETAAINPLLNALTIHPSCEAVLVLDDYHWVQDVTEIADLVRYLIEYHPPNLHIIISTRQPLPFDDLSRWRARGQALIFNRSELAFTADEIEALFSQYYGYQLSSQQVKALEIETEGWIIALQIIWQSLQSGASSSLETVLERLPDTLEGLFDYLAPEVLARQPQDVQCFLVTMSVLDQMDAPACDALLQLSCPPSTLSSGVMLRHLYEAGLFVNAIGEGTYRYQHLFQNFLQSQLRSDPERKHALHQQAAKYYEDNGMPEETIYHLLEAALYDQAAKQIEDTGPSLIRLGRLDRLMKWIFQLPEGIRSKRPSLNLLVGDVLRLRADFDGALEHYQTAEKLFTAADDHLGHSGALRGQAQVYLDTLRPLKADSLLEEASRWLEPQEYRQETAALFDQIAENKLNLGYPKQAQVLHAEAQLLRSEADPGDLYLEARAMLRTGRLEEAQRLLEPRAQEESQASASRPPRFHRETVLLLSLVCVLRGDHLAAEHLARTGIAIGQGLRSDFVQSVGYMRLGHALELQASYPWMNQRTEEAVACYRKSIELVQPFKVTRVLVEPLWGLCRVYGYRENLPQAEENALHAVDLAEQAGDVWIGNMVRVAMGSSYAMAGQPRPAEEWLDRAFQGFEQVGDSYARCAVRIWLALNAWWQGDTATAEDHLREVLPVTRANHYDELLTRCTYLGLKDDQAFLPLLMEARRRGIEPDYIHCLLKQRGLESAQDHPGYTLWVRALGPFGVWRSETPVTAQEWVREKARHLFQLFVAHPRQFLQREQITELLWPEMPADAAVRDFKVALNAVNRALEPTRSREAPPFFIIRQGNTYGLNPLAAVEIDADRFEKLAGSTELADLQQAVGLYQDQFLPDARYEDWAIPYREKLAKAFLKVADQLAQHWLVNQEWDKAISICLSALHQDACWEPAYRQLIQAYIGQGNHSKAQATYNRCRETLFGELGIDPSPETKAFLDQIRS